jgi:hypothetical protein
VAVQVVCHLSLLLYDQSEPEGFEIRPRDVDIVLSSGVDKDEVCCKCITALCLHRRL